MSEKETYQRWAASEAEKPSHHQALLNAIAEDGQLQEVWDLMKEGYTQDEIAKELGVCRATISRLVVKIKKLAESLRPKE